ncbi:M20 family metallo-hydrolase [Halorarum salinum]|uniref:M20 family metallo-hydrolase n=1 Tax=Halorarum salinum TaxID=2743089 RepID=A0A7D5Q9V3_9EURY|nr:M20 family metallo-hydrolase [Halobaculum salinum]QLG60360.1 M20 family metallo-hydrolase [Halobaculum salinum]
MIQQDRLWNSIQTLGEIGERDDGAMMRVTGSDADKRARDTLVDWFEDAGLTVTVDSVGNIVARREGRTDAAPIVTGSHVDTVPNGGRFDGVVGVLGPLEIARYWDDAGVETDRPVEVVVFTEEEGTRFGTGLLGSLVASGKLSLEDALELEDDDGTTLQATLERIGYHGDGEFELADAAGFVEMHVEQGPLLDRSGSTVGIVEAIAGITHHSITFEGEADHAGNTPMDMRRDAFMGAAEFALSLESLVTETSESTVGTVGKVSVAPNGTNVIPETARLGVDVRDTDGDRLHDVVETLRERTADMTSRRNLSVDWETHLDISPSVMNADIRRELIAATERCDVDFLELRSGAGHDAMNAQAVTPTGMLFVPSEDGISHSPREYTRPADLYRGTKVLESALRELTSVQSADSSPTVD